jgi:NADH-quinone oxidoreductase E subunit
MRTTSYAEPQAQGFSFSEENLRRAETICARYPADRKASATIALLDLAQRQNDGWLSAAAIEYVAQYLEVAPIRVYEVASFYSMFNTKPVGKHFIQVCRTTPCWLRGSDGITETCKKKLGVGLREVTDDGLFSIVEVECLGACANAPMVQINDYYYEDLTPERMEEIIDKLRAGEEVKVGSQTGRLSSAPEGGPQTLLDLPGGAGAEGDD